MEERRIRPTLNRKEFIRVAPHLPDIRSYYINRDAKLPKMEWNDKSIALKLLHGMYSNKN